MFSQASIILSRTGGGRSCMAGGMHGGGHAWQGGHVLGVCMAGETATAADGTHPTGMHFCFILYSSFYILISSVRLD